MPARSLAPALYLLALLLQGAVAAEKPFDAAAAFGARDSVSDLSLSPDGSSIAYIGPTQGPGSALFTLSLEPGAKAHVALATDGKPLRLESCNWISGARLVCVLYGVVENKSLATLLPFTRVVAVDANGGNLKMLSTQGNDYSRGLQLGGGRIIDLMPAQDGVVLMTRQYLPDKHTGSVLGSEQQGLGVDRIDTRTLAVVTVEPPNAAAIDYLSDGQGTVRIMALRGRNVVGSDTGVTEYMYRLRGSREWHKLSQFDELARTGFMPLGLDPSANVAYGLKKLDGRLALYSVSLDESLHEELLFQRPDVDLGRLVTVGRTQRVVGVHYDEEKGFVHYFDPAVAQLQAMLRKALPALPSLAIADASQDEQKLLVFAASDRNPGLYYLYDRAARQLRVLMAIREELLDVPLSAMQPVHYPAADGTQVPGYLTLPPGVQQAKGLPAIVLPHGGPAARDNWQFDWLSQYFAARGYVVLQPNYRGSAGYGDAWFEQNGFKSWQVAIGDVLDAGRWLVAQGMADPAKLAIFGWSYGGYAALQSAVVDQGLFKAVVAVAPVSDLKATKEEHRGWTDFNVVSQFIGDGPHLHEGSPLENAARIKVPVLMFHGAMDRNVGIRQSKDMAARLTSVGGRVELVTWPDLDHQLEDSQARALLLRKSDEFLRKSMGL